MLLISLMLAAAPTSAVKPDIVQRREASRARPASSAIRSKRLIELEAAVKSLPLAAAERDRDDGPKGM
ncbi:MAG TPA: hypothetical protein VFQ67_06805 [Allosphingosinicella sp.]|jgi:hypothetical protein|nr:hypothetical protein [Allosphingosinicella sp.]